MDKDAQRCPTSLTTQINSPDGGIPNSDILDSIIEYFPWVSLQEYRISRYEIERSAIWIYTQSCVIWKYQKWKQICLFGFALMQNKYLYLALPWGLAVTGAYSKLSSYNKNNPTVEGYSTTVVRGRSESQNPANSATIVIYFEVQIYYRSLRKARAWNTRPQCPVDRHGYGEG